MSRLLWTLLLVTTLLSACSLLPSDEDKTKGWSANKLYVEATDSMRAGDYEQAIKYYETLQSRYPFGRYATAAQLNVAYAYYKFDEPDSALAAADRFIKLHPRHEAAAYAYYLKGLVNFNRNLGFLERFLPTDTSQRDPAASLGAYQDFSAVVKQFPHSVYAEDARKRLVYLRNTLARHEVHVARYYLDRGAYLAAANRAVGVVEGHQRTPAVRDALLIMIAAYDKLGMEELSRDARRVLTENERQGTFAEDAQKLEEKGWSRALWESLGLDKD